MAAMLFHHFTEYVPKMKMTKKWIKYETIVIRYLRKTVEKQDTETWRISIDVKLLYRVLQFDIWYSSTWCCFCKIDSIPKICPRKRF